MSPTVGAPATQFVVSFVAPDATGPQGSVDREYTVSASESSGARGCLASTAAHAPPTHAGQLVHVTLSPGASGRWCAGRFNGTVQEVQQPVCQAGQVCPQYIAIIRKIGTFAFTVGAGDSSSPPSFAGLKAATQCAAGPIGRVERRRVHLSWNPATDSQTPRSQIVYEIYMASRPRHENFFKPTFSTRGRTSFTTPPEPLGGRYFVVRARDRAGREDRNRVERRARNVCV